MSLLDARAGSPPSAAELLRRHAGADFTGALAQFFREGERWSAELLESHLSYASSGLLSLPARKNNPGSPGSPLCSMSRPCFWWGLTAHRRSRPGWRSPWRAMPPPT